MVQVNRRNTGFKKRVDPIIISDVRTAVFGFGKHRNKTFRHVLNTEPSYIDWAIRENVYQIANVILPESFCCAKNPAHLKILEDLFQGVFPETVNQGINHAAKIAELIEQEQRKIEEEKSFVQAVTENARWKPKSNVFDNFAVHENSFDWISF